MRAAELAARMGETKRATFLSENLHAFLSSELDVRERQVSRSDPLIRCERTPSIHRTGNWAVPKFGLEAV